MLYCSTVWSNTSTQNINKLQSIQNFASKIVTNSRKFDHVTPLLRQLNWRPVKQLLCYRDSLSSVLTYKCFKGLAPKHLVDKFTKRSSINARHTRKRDLLHIILYRTATGQRTFAYRGTTIWNNLDNDITQCVSFQSFKQAIKGQLLESFHTCLVFMNSYFLIFIIYTLSSLLFNVFMSL